MVRYSNDVNVYIENKVLLSEKVIPVPLKAAGVYRRVARNLENPDARKITEKTLSDEYDEARRIFEDIAVRVYGILGAKGGVTADEWELIKSSITKGTYMFPDVTLDLGTQTPWKIKDGCADEFIRETLKKHGINVKIISSVGGKILYEDENSFIKQMATDFAVISEFKQIEEKLEIADYSGTKKRLHYLTIYDFLKFHLGLESVPTKEEFIKQLETCKGCKSASIIDARELVNKISGDFWAEYEKYREFKMVQVLARWYSKSSIRSINREVYDFISCNISESMLNKAMKYLKVHTAFLNPRSSKGDTKGTTANFNFRIQDANGDIYAVVNENSYIDDYSKASKKIKVTSMSSLIINGLEFGKNYCVSLWEDMGNGDAIKLGDLPKVTPGIKWPIVKSINKCPFSDTMSFSIVVEGGEGNLTFVGCMKKGNDKIRSVSDGIKLNPTKSGNTLKFEFKSLEFEHDYVFCVYVLLDGGKYTNKIISEFTYTPQKTKFEKIIRLSTEGNKFVFDKEISLDFADREWPELFGDGTVEFACRSDRFPESPNDKESGFHISTLTKESYKNSIFKIISADDTIYPMLYICGWLKTSTGATQLVVHSIIYHILFKFKSKSNVFKIDTTLVKNKSDLKIPVLRVACFDKNDNIVFSSNNIIPDSQGMFSVNPTGKVKFVVVEAADPFERQIYLFRNLTGLKTGKSKVSLF